MPGDSDQTIYKVVINDEEQYSIWTANSANDIRWKDSAKTGTKEESLAYIQEVWTDMRHRRLRDKMKKEQRGF